MPTSFELAVMAQGAYKLKDEEKFQLPPEWYVVHKYFPKTSWDVGIVVYEKIISIDEDKDDCRQIEFSDFPDENGKVIAFIRVERVFAFRGTVSLWNWVTNLGLFFNHIPTQTFIGMNFIRNHVDEAKNVIKIDQNADATRFPLHYQEIAKREMPQKHKKKLIRLLEQNRSLRLRVMQTTYTGHSLGASMAIVRAAHEAIAYPDQIIRAVTFDGPGSLPLLTEEKQRLWVNESNINEEKNVISYLTAPHVINTLHSHAGQIFRLYVPHIQGRYLYRLNLLVSVSEDLTRCVLSSLFAIKYFTKKDVLNISARKQLIGVFVLGSGYIVLISAFNLAWLNNQHSIENIILCFDSETHKPKGNLNNPNGKIMERWAGFYEHNFRHRFIRFMLFPFPIINRGLLDVASSNSTENKLEALTTPDSLIVDKHNTRLVLKELILYLIKYFAISIPRNLLFYKFFWDKKLSFNSLFLFSLVDSSLDTSTVLMATIPEKMPNSKILSGFVNTIIFKLADYLFNPHPEKFNWGFSLCVMLSTTSISMVCKSNIPRDPEQNTELSSKQKFLYFLGEVARGLPCYLLWLNTFHSDVKGEKISLTNLLIYGCIHALSNGLSKMIANKFYNADDNFPKGGIHYIAHSAIAGLAHRIIKYTMPHRAIECKSSFFAKKSSSLLAKPKKKLNIAAEIYSPKFLSCG